MKRFVPYLLFVAAVYAHDFARLIDPPPRGSVPGGQLPAPETYGKHQLELDCGGFEVATISRCNEWAFNFW